MEHDEQEKSVAVCSLDRYAVCSRTNQTHADQQTLNVPTLVMKYFQLNLLIRESFISKSNEVEKVRGSLPGRQVGETTNNTPQREYLSR